MYLHNCLVARQSKTLDTMMNGHMSEAKDGYATLDDVDPKVFAHFSQWLYTGKYESAGMSPKIEPADLATLLPAEIAFNEDSDRYRNSYPGNWRAPRKAASPRGQRFYAADASKQQNLWATFSGGSTSEMPHEAVPSDRASKIDLDVQYLLHAKVYCFADKYDILGLKQLAIDKLKQNLIDYVQLTPLRIAALTQLIGYTSENTLPPNGKDSDNLRDLIVQYTAIVFEILFKSQDFQDLLSADGEFFLEVVTQLLRRLD